MWSQLQWNPVNTTTIGPKYFGRNNRVVVLTGFGIKLQPFVFKTSWEVSIEKKLEANLTLRSCRNCRIFTVYLLFSCFALPYHWYIHDYPNYSCCSSWIQYSSTDISVAFSGRIDDQNVVVVPINEVVVLTGYFY